MKFIRETISFVVTKIFYKDTGIRKDYIRIFKNVKKEK